MSWLDRLFHAFRAMTGLADASESRLTPDHGWLLATPADARKQRADATALRLAPRDANIELGSLRVPAAGPPGRLLGRP